MAAAERGGENLDDFKEFLLKGGGGVRVLDLALEYVRNRWKADPLVLNMAQAKSRIWP